MGSQSSKQILQTFDENNKEVITELERQLGITEKKYTEISTKLETITK